MEQFREVTSFHDQTLWFRRFPQAIDLAAWKLGMALESFGQHVASLAKTVLILSIPYEDGSA
jgi:hypothetical protein